MGAEDCIGVRAYEEAIGFLPKGLEEGIGCVPMTKKTDTTGTSVG